MTGEFPDIASGRPLWLVTLADLALLMVGFFVLVQAHQADPRQLARSLREGFVDSKPAEPLLAVAANRLDGFAPGSAALPAGADTIAGWAKDQLIDPRVVLTVTGSADAARGDVDPATRSAAILAADRARALAARLAPLAPARVAIATTTGPAGVTVTLAFAGDPSRNRP
ncbi:hypothetical protein GCM10011380_11680 [Sphingomonas metalli]|uniref:Flagellar motor protein MotB n=1 Tax=Sphingomonas metalli TaxID=1779358 RepID=A0A916SZ04_9SPHN|nr:flagellar motor protein MotB [Sphingomonas metalli]GGB23615.1 hypothetical protein GCM10011380_11680 [Sphingomonas metalli]